VAESVEVATIVRADLAGSRPMAVTASPVLSDQRSGAYRGPLRAWIATAAGLDAGRFCARTRHVADSSGSSRR
jgi:hypothetical protein